MTGPAAKKAATVEQAAFRDPRYAPQRLEVERRADGAFVLDNAAPFSRAWRTTNAALEHWSVRAPSRVWLAERSGAGWRTLTYGEAHARVGVLAAGLAGLGLGPDKPLLILARNGVDHALVAYAAMRIGCPVAPVSPQYGLPGARPERLAHAAALIAPGAVFCDDWELFGGAVEGEPALAGASWIAARGACGRALALEALERGGTADALARPEQAAKLLLTSGSTGKPKAVICSHANVSFNAAQIDATFLPEDEIEVVVNAAPWSHSLGANAILHRVLHRGGTLYIDHGQPTAAGFGETLRNLSEISPTYHNMVPAGWALLADALERDDALARTMFAQLRVMQYGGASMPQSVCDRIEAVAVRTIGARISFATGYGATETGPTACNIHWANARSGLIGLPLPGTAVKLAPIGEDEAVRYEIRVRGPQVSPGYRAPGGGVSPFDLDEEGFYGLGDAVRLTTPGDPAAGLMFDGRTVESFKLASGTFVPAGALRVALLSSLGGLASDAVLCGEGRAGCGALLFLNLDAARALAGGTGDAAALAGSAAVLNAVRAGLARLNGSGGGGSGRIVRALVLRDAPDPHSGEMTDKGYINQGLARDRRAAEVERLFAAEPDPGVVVLE